MGIRLLCDGCEAPEPQGKDQIPFAVRGHYGKQSYYCPKCVQHVDDYLKARDELHTRLCNQWMAEHMQLDALFRHRCPKGKLPDE